MRHEWVQVGDGLVGLFGCLETTFSGGVGETLLVSMLACSKDKH